MSKVRSLSFVFVFFLVIIILTSCTESDEDSVESIVGSWTWIQSTGGIAGWTLTPDSTGESRRLVFEANSEVTFYTNEDVSLSSTYSLGVEATIFSQDQVPVVIVENDFTYTYSFPNAEQLELKENVVDRFIHIYVKE